MKGTIKYRLLRMTLSLAFFASIFGGIFLSTKTVPTKTVSAEIVSTESATAEWATGNSQVSATMNFDVANSDYSYWAFTKYDSDMNVRNNNSALAAAGMWHKTNYMGLKPLLYEAPYNATAAPSINLGYYNGDFKMTSSVMTDATGFTTSVWDYNKITYTFTDMLTGQYFTVTATTNPTSTPGRMTISVTANGDASKQQNGLIVGGFVAREAANATQAGTLFPFNLKYDTATNNIVTNRAMNLNLSLESAGLTSSFENYKVDMEFTGIRGAGYTAKLLVYSLNGYDLTESLEGQRVGSQILMEEEFPEVSFKGSKFVLPKVSVWDAIDGDSLTADLQTRVLAPDNSEVSVSNNSFTVESEGVYTVEYSVTSKTNKITTVKTCKFSSSGIIPHASLSLSEQLKTEIGVGGTLVLPAASFTFQENVVAGGWIVVERNGKIVASFDDISVANQLTAEEAGIYRISYVYQSKYGYVNAVTFEVEAIEELVIVNPNLPNQIVFGSEGYTLKQGAAKIGATIYDATIEITSPSGKVVELIDAGLFVPEEIGVYSFTYRASVGEQWVEKIYEVEVVYSSETLFTANSSIEKLIPNQDAKFLLNQENNGLAVVAASSGGEVRFKNVVDLSALGLTPIIEFQPLTESDGYTYIKSVIVTLTDVHDEANAVKVKWAINVDSWNYTYLSVNAAGYGYYGLRSDGLVFKDKYGSNRGCSFRVDKYGLQYASSISMDFKENKFVVDLYNGKYLDVIDADNIDQVGDGYQWKGFTTGEVYVSLSLPDATNGGVIITSIAGQSLGGARIVDKTVPTIAVNVDKEYVEEGMPEGVVGMEYPIPAASARDLIDMNPALDFHVEYNNTQSGKWEKVTLSGGKFIPQSTGKYKIVWTAKDAVGNIAQKELTVTVNDTPNEITATFSETLPDIFVGDKVYIPAIDAEGGNGRLSYKVEWLFNGKAIDFKAPGFYRATEKGTLKAKVTLTDYLGNVKVEELVVEIKSPDLPVLSIFDVPTSVIKGATLVLPDFTAIDYSYEKGESGYEAERKIYVNDQEIDLTGRTYTVTENAGSVLTVRYTGVGKNGTAEKTYSIYVLEPQFISDYLIYDGNKVTCELNKSYVELSASEDFTVTMPNPVSTQDMIICFYADAAHLAAGGSVSMLMTDRNDPTVQLKVTVKQISEDKLGMYLNDAAERLMPMKLKSDGAVYFTFNAFSKQITDAAGNKVLEVDTDLNKYLFDEFESGGAHIAFSVNDVKKNTYFRLNQVGNQKFTTSYKNGEPQKYTDSIEPQLSYEFEMLSTSLRLGDTISVSAARAFDVLQNTASVTVTVESPTKVLYSDVAIDESFSFATEEYGYYMITYTVKAGTRTKKLPSYFIKVKDETAPTLTVNGSVDENCKLGDKISLPNATVSDNVTSVEDLKFFVFVIESSGRYVNVTETLTYQVDKAGKYTVVYYVVDEDYNVTRKEYVVIAK